MSIWTPVCSGRGEFDLLIVAWLGVKALSVDVSVNGDLEVGSLVLDLSLSSIGIGDAIYFGVKAEDDYN
jgi:hypothetical protein